MSTYEDLPSDEALLGTFPEAAGFLAGGVALDAMMSTLEHERDEALQGRFKVVRELFGMYKDRFSTAVPASLQWQSFHKLKRPDGEHKLWVIHDAPGLALRVISNNDEVQEGGAATLHYQEYMVHPYALLLGRRSDTANKPASASGWQIPDLGTCALLEHRNGAIRMFRGANGGRPVPMGLLGNQKPLDRLDVEEAMIRGLTEVERLLNMFESGSCYEPGVVGRFH